MHATSKLRTRLPDYSKDSIPEVSVTNEDSNDGRMERKYTDGRTPIMWMITEDNTYVMLLSDVIVLYCCLCILYTSTKMSTVTAGNLADSNLTMHLPFTVFSLAYLRHVGPTSLQYRFSFGVGIGIIHVL